MKLSKLSSLRSRVLGFALSALIFLASCSPSSHSAALSLKISMMTGYKPNEMTMERRSGDPGSRLGATQVVCSSETVEGGAQSSVAPPRQPATRAGEARP